MAEAKGRSSTLQVSVRYYKRMRRGKVYPASVRWTQNQGTDQGAVAIRLLMGGAQVVPAELPLDPGDANAQATFFITPLAKGWLRGEHIEVIVGGKKVAETATPAKVTSQCMTWVLLVLTLLVPIYVAPFFSTHPFDDFQPLDPDTGERLLHPKKIGQPIVFNETTTPGEKLEAWLLYLEDRYCPTVPNTLVDKLDLPTNEKGYSVLVKEWTSNVREPDRSYTPLSTAAPDFIKQLYDLLFDYLHDRHPRFWSAAILLGLTVLSYFWHRERRTRRLSKPFALS